LMAKTWLSEDPYHAAISGFYGTRTAMQLFEEADVVIGVGASLNRYTIEHGYIFPNAKFIQLDIKPHTMMGDGRAADLYVHTDARLGVEALEAELASRRYQNPGFRTADIQARLAHQHEDLAEFDIEPDLLDAREVCRVLDDQALGSEYHKFNAHQMNAELAAIPTPDLGSVMRSFGGKGVLAHTIEEVRAAAREWVASPTPMVVDARVSRKVVTLPYRRM